MGLLAAVRLTDYGEEHQDVWAAGKAYDLAQTSYLCGGKKYY